jgi:aldose 1-epimerase
MSAPISSSDYGVLPDGRSVKCFTLTNARGVRVTLLEYGAMLASVELPDRNGRIVDVTHGYDDLRGWLTNSSYFGATIGRFGNRIADGKFTLDGKTYALAKNNTPNGIPCHLHGGKAGFNQRFWSGRIAVENDLEGVAFSYLSADGEENYPGNLAVTTFYALTDKNELKIQYRATTDRATIVNLTNHAYWNLTGDPRQNILGHRVQLDADAILAVNAGLIPTGEQLPVAGTPFDFTKGEIAGSRIEADNEQLKLGNGYDHCWVLRPGNGLRRAARVSEPTSGRVIELFSDQPGMQFYSGNFLDGSAKGKGGVAYQFRTAFCLEPQRFPDSPNHPNFPSTVLRPGEQYQHAMVYRFSVE